MAGAGRDNVGVLSGLEQGLLGEAWAGLTCDGSEAPVPLSVQLDVTGPAGRLRSRLAVEETAVACIGLALLAAAGLQRQRGGRCEQVSVDRGHVAAAVLSERSFRRGGKPTGVGFASLSRFWASSDGWVRTHANYPWHRSALLRALGTADNLDSVASALASLPSEEIEVLVFAAGGVAAAVRSVDSWRAHGQGRALAAEPLIGHEVMGDAPPRLRPASALPASGIRVLDLTRVIAGPVCTRFLAACGADVLRLDPPGYPDMAVGEVADTLLGKRSAVLDLGSAGGPAALGRLLDRADAVVCGYRPGALERFGLSPEALAERHPGVVAVYLNAWGHHGPWSARRGFDSVVQAPTGIAHRESPTGAGPGVLPCQLLDHGTGYLAAAAVLDGLRRQADQGATRVRRLSLARTAMWLTSTEATPVDRAAGEAGPMEAAADEVEAPPWMVDLDSVTGPVTAVAPPGSIDRCPLRWPSRLTSYRHDSPVWSPAPRSR